MSEDRNELLAAADRLDAARDHATDAETADRLGNFAEELRDLADAERGPDHGRLARIQHNLSELAADLGPEGSEAVSDARSHVTAYRETVEGV